MIAFAMDGITSFSVKPIRMILLLGAVVFFVSVVMLLYFLIRKLAGHTVDGWTSLACSIWALGDTAAEPGRHWRIRRQDLQ